MHGPLAAKRRPGPAGATFLEVTAPIFQASERWGAFRAEFSLAPVEDAKESAFTFVAVCGAAAMALSAGLVVLAGRSLRLRTRKISAAVEDLASGNLAARAKVAGADDIAELSAHVDRLAEELSKGDALRKTELSGLQSQVTARTQGLERQKGELSDAKRELEEARNLARSASKAKSQFMSAASKELRTPVNTILGMSDLVLGTDLEPQQRGYINCAKESALSLLATLNDIQEFSKVGVERASGAPIQFELRDLVGDTLKLLALRAQERGVELLHDIDPDVPEALVADPDRVRQVLLNVVGAAIRSAGKGEVLLRVSKSLVTDSEAGIHFVARATTKGSTISTLGASESVTMQLAELLGGKVWAEGGAFHFTATLQRPVGNGDGQSGSVEITVTGARVLIVDQSETGSRLLRSHLERHGAVVEVVGSMDDDDARSTNGPTWDVIVLDVGASEDTALLLGCAFRERGPEVGIVALRTPQENEVVNFQWKAIGAICLTKPVKESELCEAVAVCVRAAKSLAAAG